MNFKENETAQKLRGGYYTPSAVAEFLVNWAFFDGAESVLEPSCGDGKFIEAIDSAVSCHAGKSTTIDCVEILQEEAVKAKNKTLRLTEKGFKINLFNSDFFEWITNGKANSIWDVIIGNPPYIRYQYFEKTQRDVAESIFRTANVPFSKRTNAWVPFVIAGISHLAPNGRLAMVVPAEILHIHHAAGLRLLLEQEMESVAVINIRDMIFDGILQGVVLLLAKKRKRQFSPLNGERFSLLSGSGHDNEIKTNLEIVDISSVENLKDLNLEDIFNTKNQRHFSGDWMKALLTDQELSLVDELLNSETVKPFVEIADVDIGIVTGANDFFVVNAETQEKYCLNDISFPMLAKSNLIRGITYTNKDHLTNLAEGRAVNLLMFPDQPISELPSLMQEYLKSGEAQELHTRYKCRIRSPWYVVPYIWAAELSMLKRCHMYHRMVLNEAGAYSTDTAYRIKMKADYSLRAKDLTFSFLNSLTLLHTELLGRYYGGGVLELVPSEIERIPIPLIPVKEKDFVKADELVRAGTSLDELLSFTDKIILKEGLGLSPAKIQKISKAHKRLLHRRLRK